MNLQCNYNFSIFKLYTKLQDTFSEITSLYREFFDSLLHTLLHRAKRDTYKITGFLSKSLIFTHRLRVRLFRIGLFMWHWAYRWWNFEATLQNVHQRYAANNVHPRLSHKDHNTCPSRLTGMLQLLYEFFEIEIKFTQIESSNFRRIYLPDTWLVLWAYHLQRKWCSRFKKNIGKKGKPELKRRISIIWALKWKNTLTISVEWQKQNHYHQLYFACVNIPGNTEKNIT